MAGNRCRTAGKPLESRRETTGKTAGKPPGKPLETAGKSPVFGSLLPVSISDGNGREGSLRRHFSAPGGGVAIRDPLFRRNLCTFRSDGVGGTGIYGFLDVTKGLLGPMTAFAGFHDKATPKGVYTSSYGPFRGGAYPLVVKENSHDLAFNLCHFQSYAILGLRAGINKPCGGGEKACWTLMKERVPAGAVWTFCWSSWGRT